MNAVTYLESLTHRVLAGEAIDEDDACWLAGAGPDLLDDLLAGAAAIRWRFKGQKVELCSIINAKSGACSEDCGFCSQSVHHQTNVPEYPLMGFEPIERGAREAAGWGVARFGMVMAIRGLREGPELETVLAHIRRLQAAGEIIPDASLGLLTRPIARKLKEAGLQGYHHNLETSRSFYDTVCTTHSYEERVETVRIAKETGFYTCSGGIIGMGETPEQRVELAFTLRDLEVDSIPLNFLVPYPGTPMEDLEPLPVWEMLATIAMFRFVHATKDLRICGGREARLGPAQERIFEAGANGTMIGNYLTTIGREPAQDLTMIRQLGMTL
ncbi:MAG: biotin synthase BioB [Candidatus Tectomicrobia bacterium]|nr:biotin synthase BioB [Candidatus Tectomicrobia bacterium]